MTLIIGWSQPEGIYLSVDFRVTRNGCILDDAATKHLTIQYPPHDNGPRALLAYTGVAILKDGTPTGTWIRETLRGDMDEVIDDSMRHLTERLNRDVTGLRQPLIINFLVIHGQRRYFGGMSNLRKDGRVQRSFAYMARELDAPYGFANGSGAANKKARLYSARLQRQTGKPPNRATDYMKLLSLVNRDIASVEPTVSPHCRVAFIPDAGFKFQPMARTYTESGESVPFDFPLIVLGIDVSELAKHAMQQFQVMRAGQAAPIDVELHRMNEQQKRRP